MKQQSAISNQRDAMRQRQGFTLIELSIVLVVIGLLVGGVLVGNDLIKAAALRATISQKEQFDSAVNTFRLKYNGLPGDLRGFATFSGSLTTTGLDGTNGYGDGNRLIGPIYTTGTYTGVTVFMGESKLFWKHLSEAGLINDDISLVTTAVGAEIDAKGNGYVPPAKLGKGTFWTVGNHLGRNFYSLSKVEITSIDVGSYMVGHGKFTEPSAITPLEAYQIDTKMDDGLPATGSLTTNAAVIVSTFPSVNFLTAITKTGFVNLIDSPCANTITNSYKIATPAEADALTCRSLIINAGF